MQHGVLSRTQLLALGLSSDAIRHRLATGRLHVVHRGVYAVGRPELTREGVWLAAVLSCGPSALLSHESAAALWAIHPGSGGRCHVSVPYPRAPRHTGVTVHRRTALGPGDRARRRAIPVTTPVCTLIDLAARIGRERLERAINEADKRDLVDPDALRLALEGLESRPGLANLRETLDRRTFTLTDSELERRFLPIASRAGLPLPLTAGDVNGFRVDFHWPAIGLVVETDGLRYHRTPAEQARDRVRDQAHLAAGLTPLRFTHAQVRYEPARVQALLEAVAGRLATGRQGRLVASLE